MPLAARDRSWKPSATPRYRLAAVCWCARSGPTSDGLGGHRREPLGQHTHDGKRDVRPFVDHLLAQLTLGSDDVAVVVGVLLGDLSDALQVGGRERGEQGNPTEGKHDLDG